MTRWLATVVLVATTATAAADDTKVFPLTGQTLPPALANAPEAMTDALATSISGTVASVPIEDAAAVSDCDPDTTACLEKIAKQLGVKRLVFGTVSGAPAGKVRVVLTRFDVGPARQQRTYTLDGGTARELADELARVTGELFDRPAAAPVVPVEPKPPPPDETPSRPTLSTWIMIGIGAAVTGVGAGYLVSASNLRDEYDAAPDDTLEDIQHLMDLEATGNSRVKIGRVLVIGGGIVMAAGIVRAIYQLPPRPSPATAFDIRPTAGGAAVSFTRSF